MPSETGPRTVQDPPVKPLTGAFLSGYEVYDETVCKYVRSFNLAYYGMCSPVLSPGDETGPGLARRNLLSREKAALNKALLLFNVTEEMIERVTGGIAGQKK
jgi:hypothetical protein